MKSILITYKMENELKCNEIPDDNAEYNESGPPEH